LSVLQINEE